MAYTDTTNYKFKKPDATNKFTVADLNNGLDAIDATIKNVTTNVDTKAVHKEGAETINGVKTFTETPIIPALSGKPKNNDIITYGWWAEHTLGYGFLNGHKIQYTYTPHMSLKMSGNKYMASASDVSGISKKFYVPHGKLSCTNIRGNKPADVPTKDTWFQIERDGVAGRVANLIKFTQPFTGGIWFSMYCHTVVCKDTQGTVHSTTAFYDIPGYMIKFKVNFEQSIVNSIAFEKNTTDAFPWIKAPIKYTLDENAPLETYWDATIDSVEPDAEFWISGINIP